MIQLPPALANPPDGRYSLDQAVTVWLAIYHGYQPGSPDSLDFRRARQRAARELEPIIQHETPSAPTGPRIVRRQSTWFDHARNTPRESSRRVIKRTIASVTKSDMIELARQHGIEMEPQVQREPMERQAEQVRRKSPGRPAKIPPEALDEYDRLRSQNIIIEAATKEVAEKFCIDKPDSIRTASDRRKRERE
ncbi:hypothetical protein [Thiorhodovibrio frisius]|uniref:Uncharacterized protein n=1 Tax=Thiorhodovibrio frisius TaxID=631362 RepID=H8YXW2_9GAMM|nr:hypothetical protein [Thiorhodovibrio frisius]EIC23288.1 hypothetical protein Thi970DRAFT_00945 [Thiorhodovibrio frisius]WPL23634.1 hypothetical protein Thiofri_03829 [Thiorhodovibrio frisius]